MDKATAGEKSLRNLNLVVFRLLELRSGKNSITVTLWFEKPLKLLSLDQRNWTVYLHTVLRYLLNEPANNASLRQRLNLPESKSSTVSKLFRQTAEGGLVKPFDKHSSNKTKRYVPVWCPDSSQIPVKTKDYEKLKLEKRRQKLSESLVKQSLHRPGRRATYSKSPSALERTGIYSSQD